MENEKNNVIKKAYEEADEYLKNVQAKARSLVDKISKDELKKEEAKSTQRSLNMLRNSFIEDKKKNVKEKKVFSKDIDIHEGEEVLVKSLNQMEKCFV